MKVHFRNHPVHIMLAHFPSALLPTSFIFNLIGWFYDKPALFRSSFYCQWAGVVMGGLAITLGLIDLYGIYERDQKKLINTGILHGSINAFVIIAYFVMAFYRLKHGMEIDLWLLVIESFVIVFLLIGNFFGGEIYQKLLKEQFGE